MRRCYRYRDNAATSFRGNAALVVALALVVRLRDLAVLL
jgi:hypothetical protein